MSRNDNLCGFIRKESQVDSNRITYDSCDDPETLAIAPEEDVVFASSFEEAAAILQREYPCEDKRLTRVRADQGYDIKVYIEPMYFIKAELYNSETHERNRTEWIEPTVQDLVALAKEYGRVPIDTGDHEIRKWLSPHLAKQGVMIKGEIPLDKAGQKNRYDEKYFVEHKPAKAKRWLNRSENRGITMHELFEMEADLLKHVWKSWNFALSLKGLQGFENVVAKLWRSIMLFNLIYGKNAHRKVPEFQEFKNKWKDRLDETEKKFIKIETVGVCTGFVDLMRLEIKISKPKKMELKRDESLQPLDIINSLGRCW